MFPMNSFVLELRNLDKTRINIVGGKSANLGEFTKIEGINEPGGFCISTEAFKRIIAETPVDKLLSQLSRLEVKDRDEITVLSAEIRRVIEDIVIPRDIQEGIMHMLAKLGEKDA